MSPDSLPNDAPETVYPATRAILGEAAWARLQGLCGGAVRSEGLADALTALAPDHVVPDFLPDLARVEWARHAVASRDLEADPDADAFALNPTLEVLRPSWRVCGLVSGSERPPAPQPGEEFALVWRDRRSGQARVRAASDEDLFAIKVVADELSLAEAAAQSGLSEGKVEASLFRAADLGVLVRPRSLLRRDPAGFRVTPDAPELMIASPSFTIQWHVTHACDLRCKHCYDRTRRSTLTADQARAILDDLHAFCRSRRVRGHVCFTGGNPFLYPHFAEVYRAAAEHGFTGSILGNPVPRARLEEVISIQRPGYYQVSLEGLPEHNDDIRGPGHFASVIEFLGVLRDLGVSTAVMLTLTRDNLDQVVPLAERLRGHVEYLTFNRLSPVGEGASLQLPEPARYAEFLRAYVEAAQHNPILGFKDNLINLVRRERGEELFDGCTGYGCGAAFNFVAVLPDGETHACRKFPSPIGNVLRQGFAEVYDSPEAQRYRNGTTACAACALRTHCGGCYAIANGLGRDIFKDRDPFCFLEEASVRPV